MLEWSLLRLQQFENHHRRHAKELFTKWMVSDMYVHSFGQIHITGLCAEKNAYIFAKFLGENFLKS
jgi:hypothetical protein